MPDRETVLEALERIADPKSGKGLVSAGLVRGVAAAHDRAGFALQVRPGDKPLYEAVRAEAETALKALPGVERVLVVLSDDDAPPEAPPAAPLSPLPRRRTAGLSREAVDQGRAKAPVPSERPAHVRRVIAVASGKGGVGKSTVAVNLACAFAARGWRTGLLDADVHGPSAPLMLGISGKPGYEDGAIVPHDAWGLQAMSTGLLVEADDAMIWRGPMASQALNQMLTQTRWGTEDAPLDVLVVDLPPGTGDVQLTLIQKTPLDGVVIVSTPQEAALADARRAKTLFERVNVPVLGLIENMTGEVFGRGGAQAEAARLDLPFLGEIPLDGAVRVAGDAGAPLVAVSPDSETAKAFVAVAGMLAEQLDF